MTRSGPKLTEGPVGKQLLSMAAPMTLGMIGMAAFNLTDAVFIGRLGSLMS